MATTYIHHASVPYMDSPQPHNTPRSRCISPPILGMRKLKHRGEVALQSRCLPQSTELQEENKVLFSFTLGASPSRWPPARDCTPFTATTSSVSADSALGEVTVEKEAPGPSSRAVIPKHKDRGGQAGQQQPHGRPAATEPGCHQSALHCSSLTQSSCPY